MSSESHINPQPEQPNPGNSEQPRVEAVAAAEPHTAPKESPAPHVAPTETATARIESVEHHVEVPHAEIAPAASRVSDAAVRQSIDHPASPSHSGGPLHIGIFALVLLVVSIAGLATTIRFVNRDLDHSANATASPADTRNAGSPDHRGDPERSPANHQDAGTGHRKHYFLAVFSAGLGLALLLAGRAWRWHWWQRLELGHIAHELGMAFIVSGVVFASIELTLHVIEARASAIERDRFVQSAKQSQQEFQTATAKAQGDFLTATKEAQAKFDQDIHAQFEIREHVTALLSFFGKRGTKTSEDYAAGLKALNQLLGKGLDRDQLEGWETAFLDQYGMHLLRQGVYSGAAAQFKNALVIDNRRAQANPFVYDLQLNVPFTHSRLAKAHFVANRLGEAQQEAAEAVKLFSHVAETVKTHKDHGDKAASFLARAERDLAELRQTSPLTFRGTLAEKRDALEESDLPAVRGFRQGDIKEKMKVYALPLERGKKYSLEMIASLGELSSKLDPYLILDNGMGILDNGTGNILAENDDDPNKKNTAGKFDSRIEFSCDRTGVYRLIATTFYSPIEGFAEKTGAFLIRVQQLAK